MKTTSVLIALLLPAMMFAQSKGFDKVPVATAEECKSAEPKVLEAANYLIDHPLDCKDKNCEYGRKLIIEWQTNTPDYSFQIDVKIVDLSKGNDMLLGVVMACMTKYALENPADAKDALKMKVGSFNLIADYAAKSTNGVKATKQIKKLLEAKKKGKMQEFAEEEK